MGTTHVLVSWTDAGGKLNWDQQPHSLGLEDVDGEEPRVQSSAVQNAAENPSYIHSIPDISGSKVEAPRACGDLPAAETRHERPESRPL